MEESNLDELVHSINMRRLWLNGRSIKCPLCHGPTHLIGIRLFPRWICEHCNNIFRYEPIKNLTPCSTFNDEEM